MTVSKLIAGLRQADVSTLNLKTLKLRHASIGDASIHELVHMCRHTLARLDVSFTGITMGNIKGQSPIYEDLGLSLEKLCLTSADVSRTSLLAALRAAPNLKYLALGNMGGGKGANFLDNEVLMLILPVLETLDDLENVSFVGNIRLGASPRGGGSSDIVAEFISKVGRRCKARDFCQIATSAIAQVLLSTSIYPA